MVLVGQNADVTLPSGKSVAAYLLEDATVTAGNGVGDTIIDAGAGGINTLNGANSGKDTFVFSGDFGQVTINNFITKQNGNYDTLQLSKAEFGDLATMIRNNDIQQVGANTVITNPLNHADTITLTGISTSTLISHPSNFTFG